MNTIVAPVAIVVFDIDGVLRDVGGSYRRALADTVEHFTQGAYRPSHSDIDTLKNEGIWNNDWDASQELTYRYFERQGQVRSQVPLNYESMVAFFQSRYRGPDPNHWTGYICHEPLLLDASYFAQLSDAGIAWGFFSGATSGSARYVLETRLGLESPILVAMEDAPSKPDPAGLFQAICQIEAYCDVSKPLPVLYAGDTVADMQTIQSAIQEDGSRSWIGVGVLPPHALHPPDYRDAYASHLEASGAAIVLDRVRDLTPETVEGLLGAIV